ncbi:zinc finger protein 41-like isoform X2 [Conger conger]|uniref:zinc finger protein 41-like isoform X2 n=1 Tax=Conger conger TaxID=82655 RepID=UPI002A5ABE92|nr:zinc finger protein 41-like isoform X2 [Conger conger]XP_061095778.1 zinc finger protein 41-like isoform X2 [Conger conger]XP_061095779.1 zinc finger protein 41-like isoform X2 [Conger conger]
MMQAGVCLRQDTETTLPELTEQHRIKLKEEELSGLESVHMAESETECTTPGLNTLEPECVTAHSGVSAVHHTDSPLIKTEPDLGPTNTGDLIKTESLDFTELVCRTHLHPDQIKTETYPGHTHTGYLKTENLEVTELGYVTHLHPDQIKTETDDEGYIKAEHISVLQDIKCDDITSDEVNTVLNGAGVHQDQTEPWQCAGEPNPHCRKPGKEQDCSTQHVRCLNEPSELIQDEGNRNCEKPHQCSLCGKRFPLESHLNNQNIHSEEKPNTCSLCGKCFTTASVLQRHQRIHTGISSQLYDSDFLLGIQTICS